MLYITRHGKTDWNNRHKMQGRTDIPLNDVGRKMAEQAATVEIHLQTVTTLFFGSGFRQVISCLLNLQIC